MTFPTPTGAPTMPSQATGSAYTASYFQQLFSSRWGAAAGNAYLAYNSSHPGSTPYQNGNAFLNLVLVEGLDNAIRTAAGTAGTLGQIPGAAATGASTAYQNIITTPASLIGKAGAFLNDLTSASLWERIGEVVLGLILVAVGVAHLTHAVPIATKIAKKVAEVAPLAMA